MFVYRDLGIINARIVGPIGYENISHPLVMFGMDHAENQAMSQPRDRTVRLEPLVK